MHSTRTIIKKNRGFTLIELLVVIAIIGFLAATVMSSLQTAREKSYDAQIASDMNQIKNALELYANDNNFDYPDPQLSQSDQEDVMALATTFSSRESIVFNTFNFFAKLFSIDTAYAQVVRNRNCLKFDLLSVDLVPKYIGAIPRHPLDDGINVCYQYFKSASMGGGLGEGGSASRATSVAYAPLVTQKYSQGNSKQIGVVLGNTEPEALMEICAENLEDTGTPFPLFTGLDDRCSGEIADAVIGITDGEGDVNLSESCSIPEYDTQEECEDDHSYCSDPQYTSQGETVCEAHGSTVAGTCTGGDSGNPAQFTTETSCVNASYISNEGYCSNGNYNTQYSCENVVEVFMGAYCSNSNFSDQQSCESQTYESSPGYCSNGYSSQDDCSNEGGWWVPPQYTNYGYTWTPEQTYNPGYLWTPPQYTNYGYTWTPGSYTPNDWIYVPGGEWGVY